MSHFTVLVAADDEKQLQERLQPFHEYECTGIKDQYVVWVDETEELTRDYNSGTCPMVFEGDIMLCSKWDKQVEGFWRRKYTYAHSSDDEFCLPEGFSLRDVPLSERYSSVKEYALDYCGYDELACIGSKVRRFTNPNAKWDWWKIGGRWPNLLNGKNNEIKKNVDWQGMIQKSASTAQELYRFVKGNPDFQLKDAFEAGFGMIKRAEVEMISQLSEADYVARYVDAHPPFFAWIGTDGVWHQRAEMGWWGVTSDDNALAGQVFKQCIDMMPDDQMLYVVDCHI